MFTHSQDVRSGHGFAADQPDVAVLNGRADAQLSSMSMASK